MSDTMVNGRKFSPLNLIDDCTCEILAIEIDAFLSSKLIIKIFERVILEWVKQSFIRIDNGPDFTSTEFELCAKDNEIQIQLFNLEDQCIMDT